MDILNNSRVVIFCDNKFGSRTSKVATSYLRYKSTSCVGVIDKERTEKTVNDVLGYGGNIPIVSSINHTDDLKPDVLLIGVGLFSNALPTDWRDTIIYALTNRMHVVSGLHFRLSTDPEFAALAKEFGVKIWDTKEPPEHLVTSRNKVRNRKNFVIHTVGSDCRVGKKTSALEITQEANKRGISCGMAATGQSGIYISGNGVAIDAVPADFIAGAAEALTIRACDSFDWVVVEGQGAITHPAYSGVTVGLLHGTQPEALILCHQARLDHHKDWPDNKLQPLDVLIEDYERLASYMRPAKVVAISVNCEDMSEEEAKAYISDIENTYKLPATDVIKFGAGKLVDSLNNYLSKKNN
ncbi:DUF1611 domain-containing protein [Vibrio lentus]